MSSIEAVNSGSTYDRKCLSSSVHTTKAESEGHSGPRPEPMNSSPPAARWAILADPVAWTLLDALAFSSALSGVPT